MLYKIEAKELANFITNKEVDQHITMDDITQYANEYLLTYGSKNDKLDDLFSLETLAYTYSLVINSF